MLSSLRENSRNLASSSCGLGPGTTGHIMEHGGGVRREPQSSSIPTLPFESGQCNSEPIESYQRNLFSEWCDGLSDLGTASWKIPGLIGIRKLESQLQD